jgi:DNA modification methylase
MSEDDYMAFIFSVLDRCAENVNDVHSVVWNVAYNANSRNTYGKIVFSDRNPFSVFETIAWNKGGSINLPQVGIYSRRCEFVFVMARGEKYLTSQLYGNPRWNYWETKKQNQTREHHAAFPLEFAERGIKEFSVDNNIIYEPFAGTGTTIIAAQNLGRRCYAMEISAEYGAVILERFHSAFPSEEIRLLE